MFRIFNLFSLGDAHLALPSLRRVTHPGKLSTSRGRFRTARRSRGRVLQLEPMEDRMMLSTLLSVSKTGPIHVSGPTAFHTTALSPPHTTTGRVIPSVHVSGPTTGHIGQWPARTESRRRSVHVSGPTTGHIPVLPALSPVHTTVPVISSVQVSGPPVSSITASSPTPTTTGLVTSPVQILTGGGGGSGTAQLDGDGYVENFSGLVQIVEQTWNYDKGAYDQAPPVPSSNLKSMFDLMWGATDQPSTIAGSLRDAFIKQTTQYLQNQGYGVGGGGVINFQLTDPSVNELRIKQNANYLELKYLASGSEDFYVAHPGIGADPHVTITFDVEVAAEINVWPYIDTSTNNNLGPEPPLIGESAVVQLHNAQVSSTHDIDSTPIVNLIDSQSFDFTSQFNTVLPTFDSSSNLVAEANRGFSLLSFAIDGNSSLVFYVSQSTDRTMNLQVLGWQAPIPDAGYYSPESLALVQTSGPTSGSWTVDVSDPASVTNGRYVSVTLSIIRSHLPPIRVPYNGPIKDPDFPKFREIVAPNIPYGTIAEWHLTFDLKTGAVSGDATGFAGQKLQVSDSSGDAVQFTLSAQ